MTVANVMYQRDEPMLTLTQAAEVLGEPEADVLADAASGCLTWAVADGETLYPEACVRALAARRAEIFDDPLITVAHAADILGVGRPTVSTLLARDPAAAGQRAYRRSAVLALAARRAARPQRLTPERSAGMLAARKAQADGPLTPDELAAAQALRRSRQARS